ncbi:MAG: CCA tRNA nucleotidyltransferase [Firmicutes bacterium]|nr:CCA tRNA nucleotidyltransferase [Bacillota bacterium]
MKLPKDVETIINRLEDKGFEAYVVGGCVRDHLMGIPPHDYDITTSALPEDIKRLFTHTVDTGIKHGTVTVIINKTGYEITTFRLDGEYKDNRHPESVIFTPDLKEDLSRRDFTVNAIAYNHIRGYVDIFKGKDDIHSRVIRGVGDADKRFKEDALRMMRALRFSAQLDFTIEKQTMKAVEDNAHLLKNISPERIREEFFKLILSNHNERIPLLLDSGLMNYFLPEAIDILKSKDIPFYRTMNVLSHSLPLRLSFIMHPLDVKKIREIFIRLRTDNKTINDTVLMVSLKDRGIKTSYDIRKIVNLSGELSNSVLEFICAVRGENITLPLKLLNDVYKSGDCCTLSNLAINGKDVTEAGFKGKSVGVILSKALEIVLKNPQKNERETLLKFIKTQRFEEKFFSK